MLAVMLQNEPKDTSWISEDYSEVGQRSCFQGLYRGVRRSLSELGFASCTKSILTNSALPETAVSDSRAMKHADTCPRSLPLTPFWGKI